ncbi:glycoside hydrolase family 16 protein [Aestuariivirga sp.]|uniref:glycoside hydrolase family 16 protein n=1 Tax=Aestuariivirga sp. TaxID=2650926 RepID=UPI0035B28932
MKLLGIAAALASLLFANDALAATVLMRDDFSGTRLKSSIWNVGDWMQGRSQLGNIPIVGGGHARLYFDTYRFRGTEIYTTQTFSRGAGIEVEARCRLNRIPPGLITSLFTYIFDDTANAADEIDIELITKQLGQTPGGAPVNFTTFNDWQKGTSVYQDGIRNFTVVQTVAGLNVNKWHTYLIRWLPDRTEWLIDGKIVATSSIAQPDAAQRVHLDFWAPAADWPDAYDSRLQPAAAPRRNARYFFDVDYVEVRSLP